MRRPVLSALVIGTALTLGALPALADTRPGQPATAPTVLDRSARPLAPRPAPDPRAPRAGTDESQDAPRQLRERQRPPQRDPRSLREPGRAAAPASPAPASLAAAPACRIADFASRDGSALVGYVKSVTPECLNTLFSVTGGDARSTLSETKMVTVADALRTASASYDGTNASGTMQLILYLRAGYYVNFYHPADTGGYGSRLSAAARAALDAFFASPRAFTATNANGDVLDEAVTLIDSAGENTRFLWVVTRLLTGYGPEQAASRSLKSATNRAYTVLFRGHQVPGFPEAVAKDPRVLTVLKDFALAHTSLLGTEDAYLDTNAGRELARFLGDPVVRPLAKPLVIQVLRGTSLDGPTSGLWTAVAAMAQDLDAAACADYGTCGLADRLMARILPITRTCDAHRTIRAQKMTEQQLADTCASLIRQDAYAQRVFGTSTPVADDHNDRLEVDVFDSASDYGVYAGAIFGIDTNNGGMYLEGDPAKPGNQPRFIAYRADWLPSFSIWNLNHEYTHYLDGRYTMYGGFTENMKTPTVWWVEGIAEYVSYHYRGITYEAAVRAAGQGTYRLSQLFDTTYSHDTARVYQWGYLATRFMLDRHRQELDTVLGFYRTGDWAAARSYLTQSIGTAYDGEFSQWLSQCAAGGCAVGTTPSPTTPDPSPTTPDPSPTTPDPTSPGRECTGDQRSLQLDCVRSGIAAGTGQTTYLYVSVPAGTERLVIVSSGGRGDSELLYSATGWATDQSAEQRSDGLDNEAVIVVDRPAPGTHYVSLRGKEAFTGARVTVTR